MKLLARIWDEMDFVCVCGDRDLHVWDDDAGRKMTTSKKKSADDATLFGVCPVPPFLGY